MFEPYEEEREAARKETERLDEMIRRVYAEKTRAVGEDKRIELLDHLIYTAERIKDETWVVLLVGIRREIELQKKVDALKVELLGQLTEQKHDDGGIDETDD